MRRWYHNRANAEYFICEIMSRYRGTTNRSHARQLHITRPRSHLSNHNRQQNSYRKLNTDPYPMSHLLTQRASTSSSSVRFVAVATATWLDGRVEDLEEKYLIIEGMAKASANGDNSEIVGLRLS